MGKWIGVGVAVLLIVAMFLVFQTLFIVSEIEQAIILQFGDPIATITEPGLAFKLPFIQNVIRFEKRILSSDAPPQEYLTAGKKRLVVDHVTRDIVFSEIRRELATADFIDVISEERAAIMKRVAISAAEKATEFGIDVVDVRIKRADLPDEVEQSIYSRMRAERQRESSLFRAEGEELANIIRAEADRDATVILAEGYQESQALRGEGEAEAIVIYADALSQDLEFYAFSRRLDSYADILKEGDMIVIPADSDFFRYLGSSAAPADPETVVEEEGE
jgi:membrane protease subunit HflC